MKKIFLFILTILTLFLTSCGQDTTQVAKDEFSKYYNGKDEVVLIRTIFKDLWIKIKEV